MAHRTASRRRSPSLAAWPPTREMALICSTLAAEVPGLSYGGCQLSVLAIHADRTASGAVIRPHRHSHYEAILILEGEAREPAPSGRTLAAGVLQLHAPGDLHAWSSSRGALLRLGIWFTMQPAVAARLPDVWPRCPAFRREAQALLADVASTAPGRRERLAARLTLLLAPALALLDLPDRPQAISAAGADAAPGIAAFVERFLADNLTEPLALEDVAAQFNVSVPTLTRRFRQETSESVMARLQGMRLRQASDLLRAGSVSVKEAGAAVGIPEPSYFCRCFRRAFGCSPRRFADGHMEPRRRGDAERSR